MRRRVIRGVGQNDAAERQDRLKRVRELLQLELNAPLERVEKFIDFLAERGWDTSDILTAGNDFFNSTQTEQVSRAFLHFNEHVIDQLFLTQGVHTDFRDTRNDPNFALRHRWQTELIFRRMTVGDNLLMLAAHDRSARYSSDDCNSEHRPHYWEEIWTCLRDILMVGNVPYLREGKSAAATALEFAGAQRGLHPLNRTHLRQTFMATQSPFNTGVVGAYERVRQPDSSKFREEWRFAGHETEPDRLFMLATTVTLFGIDNYAALAVGIRQNPLDVIVPLHGVFRIYLYNHAAPVVSNEPYVEPSYELDDGRPHGSDGVTIRRVDNDQETDF